MKLVILSHYYPPDKPGRIPESIATEMAARGHDVRVLTTFPHFDTGRIAEGYRQRFRHIEQHGPIQVRRVPIIPSHSRNPIGRIANYVSFACSARLARDFVKEADVIYVHGTPATTADPARVWSKSLGIPFVYHVQDIWPESVTESGFLPKPVSRAAEGLISRWLGGVYARAAAVNAIAPTAQQLLIERGVPREKCHLVFNWAYEEGSQFDRSEPLCEGLTLVYAGNLGGFQDLGTVVRAAHAVRDLEGFRLLIAGSGVEESRLRALVSELGVEGIVQFLGSLEREQMPALYARADFQIVPLKNFDFFAGTIPSKFQAGLAHGLPLITTVKGDLTSLVREHQLGFTAVPEDVDSLADAFRRAYATSPEERQAFSRRATQFYENHLSRAKAMDRLEAILRAAADTRTETS